MSMTQTISQPTTRTFRNDATGYTVTLTDNGRGSARVVDSLGYDFAMVGSDYPFAALLAESRADMNGAVEAPAPAPQQMASPLEESAQVRSSRPLATGATLTMPEASQARCLAWSARTPGNVPGCVRRGPASWLGNTATVAQLTGMARRGWLELDHPYRPTLGTITDTGRRALAAYVAQHGEVL